MPINANNLEHHATVQTDICIIGCGTAGIALAREFIGQPFRVSILESGGLNPDRENQLLNWGENVGYPYYSLDTARPRYIGGSTNRWHLKVNNICQGARMRPLEEIDFLERDWVPHSGWPFEKGTLNSYYDRAQKVCKITPLSFETKDWEDSIISPRLQLSEDSFETVIFKFGSKYPFLNDYVNDLNRSDNVDIYINSSVTEIITEKSGNSVSRINVTATNGKSFSVLAKVFILSAGAIENARLLLVSRSVQNSGLGNHYDLVGRYFMEHPHCQSGIFVPSVKALSLPLSLYRSVHLVNGVSVIGKLGFTENTLRRDRLLGHVFELYPKIVLTSSLKKYPLINSPSVLALRDLLGRRFHSPRNQLKTVLSGLEDIATTLYRRSKSRFSSIVSRKRIPVFELRSMSEQIPNPDSRVILSDEKDSLGVQRIKLDWKLDAQDIRSIVKAHELLDKTLKKEGLGRVFLQLYEENPSKGISGGWHHMGTTRMHKDPRMGVVDEHCKVHGLSNLFIAGPSVFPTGGYANPVLTIVALSIKLADHVKRFMS